MPIECSSSAAGWCEICGDCLCGEGPEDRRDGRANPACPLHGEAGTHGEVPVYETVWGTFIPEGR